MDIISPIRRKSRVLLFSPDYSLGGGVAAFDELLRRKLNSDFLTEQFVAGRRPGLRGKVFRAVMPIYDSIRLMWLLMRNHHDIYHLNPSLVPRSVIRDGLFLLVLRVFRRRQVLVFIRGWDTNFYNVIFRFKAFRFLFRLSYSHASKILVLASSFAKDLESLGIQSNRVHTISTMFDGEIFRHVMRSREDDAIVIVFLARLVATKGIYELLDGFRRVSLQNPNVALIVAGDGPEACAARDWCARKNIQDRVQFTGHVDGIDKAQLLINADIFALPSYREGCPNALLEAMSAGLPVIVTSVGGIPDVVDNDVNGLIVASHDSNVIAEAIKYLADNARIRSEMGAKNRTEAWKKYEATAVTQRIESHYRAIVHSISASNE